MSANLLCFAATYATLMRLLDRHAFGKIR